MKEILVDFRQQSLSFPSSSVWKHEPQGGGIPYRQKARLKLSESIILVELHQILYSFLNGVVIIAIKTTYISIYSVKII